MSKQDIEDIDALISILRNMRKSSKKIENLSGVDIMSLTQRGAEKNSADLAWEAVAIDKSRHEAHAKAVDLGIAEKRGDYSDTEHNPSSFHCYKYIKPLPRCCV